MNLGRLRIASKGIAQTPNIARIPRGQDSSLSTKRSKIAKACT